MMLSRRSSSARNRGRLMTRRRTVASVLFPNDQACANLQLFFIVHLEQLNGDSTGQRLSLYPCAVKMEMVMPVLSSRVKQINGFPCIGVHATEIWSLAQIAVWARQTEVRRTVIQNVLTRLDVFDMERQERGGELRKPTVLATIPGTFADQSPSGRVDHAAPLEESSTLRALVCSNVTNCEKLTYCSYSDRSSSVNVPRLALSASSSTRVCNDGSARRSAIRRATSGVRHCPTGSSKRSMTEISIVVISGVYHK